MLTCSVDDGYAPPVPQSRFQEVDAQARVVRLTVAEDVPRVRLPVLVRRLEAAEHVSVTNSLWPLVDPVARVVQQVGLRGHEASAAPSLVRHAAACGPRPLPVLPPCVEDLAAAEQVHALLVCRRPAPCRGAEVDDVKRGRRRRQLARVGLQQRAHDVLDLAEAPVDARWHAGSRLGAARTAAPTSAAAPRAAPTSAAAVPRAEPAPGPPLAGRKAPGSPPAGAPARCLPGSAPAAGTAEAALQTAPQSSSTPWASPHPRRSAPPSEHPRASR
eukprot:58837-Chlamydomonas_euryale.AAC.3